MVVYAAQDLQSRAQVYDLLALAAREEWNMDALPEIARRAGGKPWFPAAQDRAFNLSHSGSLALCALDSEPVGADIQLVKPHRPALPAKVCSPQELAWLERQEERWAGFTVLWALKESRAKQSGRGLTSPIAALSVPLFQPGETLSRVDGLWFRLYTGSGWAAAVCGQNPPPEGLRWRRLSPAFECVPNSR